MSCSSRHFNCFCASLLLGIILLSKPAKFEIIAYNFELSLSFSSFPPAAGVKLSTLGPPTKT